MKAVVLRVLFVLAIGCACAWFYQGLLASNAREIKLPHCGDPVWKFCYDGPEKVASDVKQVNYSVVIGRRQLRPMGTLWCEEIAPKWRAKLPEGRLIHEYFKNLHPQAN